MDKSLEIAPYIKHNQLQRRKGNSKRKGSTRNKDQLMKKKSRRRNLMIISQAL